MRRTYLYLAVLGLSPLLALLAWRASSGQAPGKDTDRGAAPLPPLTQVVLFNTGVGYFQREGTVEGNARLEMDIPLGEVNDLLKTLSIDDGGQPAGVSIDGGESMEETLAQFPIDLANNPGFGDLLNQARGERVEVGIEGGPGLSATALSGTVIGMQSHIEGQESHHLTLLTADGVRRVPLAVITRVRLLDPRLDDDFRRALAALSGGRGGQRRRVTLHLKGAGKRTITIAHVGEAPIWKATHRLDLAAKGNKAALVTHAVVENTTDSDWKDVRLVLVSGRPVLFQMDLARSLFVPRPTVQPRYYASLRPPEQVSVPRTLAPGQSGGQVGGGLQVGTRGEAESRSRESRGQGTNLYQLPPPRDAGPRRLSYQELTQRRDVEVRARETERVAAMRHGSLLARQEALESIAVDADRIGEAFRHTVEHKVTVPRQRSALLPVVRAAVEVSRVSIYNRSVHPFFPMSSLRVKNTSGQPIQQGPVAVREEGVYAGDARLPDLQPNQEKLVSYAMDLGLEVRPTTGATQLLSRALSIEGGMLLVRDRSRMTTSYRITNRSKGDRVVIVEHPRLGGWSLYETAAPAGSNELLYRWEWTVAAGEAITRTVTEEKVVDHRQALSNYPEPLRKMAAELNTTPTIRQAMRDHAAKLDKEVALDGEINALSKRYKALLEEQERMRKNLDSLPEGSTAARRIAERFDKLEDQVVKLAEQIAAKRVALGKLREEHEKQVNRLSVR